MNTSAGHLRILGCYTCNVALLDFQYSSMAGYRAPERVTEQ